MQFPESDAPFHGFAVRTRRSHGVESIDGADDARGQRNVFAVQTVGITAAIEAFVVMQNRFADVLERGHAIDEIAANGGVFLNDGKLFEHEFAGFEQNSIGNADLSDIVKQRGIAHRIERAIAHAETPRNFNRNARHAFAVTACVSVLGFDGIGQNRHG